VFAATTQFLIVMVAGWLNEGIRKQLEHALLECRTNAQTALPGSI
jgi:hypothetical protein